MEIEDDVIMKMQEKIAWLEATLEENNQEISKIMQTLENMQRQVQVLQSKITEPDAVRDLKDETPPPHY